MLISKSKNDLPYYSRKPLSNDTEWIAIPLFISSTEQNFNLALNVVKEILSKAQNILEEEISTLFQFETSVELLKEKGFILEDKEFEKLNIQIAFLEVESSLSKYNASIQVSTHIFLNLKDKNSWRKMLKISHSLDALYTFVLKYKKEKHLYVKIG